MPFCGVGGARIFDQSDQIAPIGRVANRHVHTLVSYDAGDDQMAGFKIAQHVVDVGRVENAGRGLGQDDLVLGDRELIDDAGLVAALGQMHVRQPVIQ
ncbi:hypothetical protein D3C76_1551550 [compost metagenome]